MKPFQRIFFCLCALCLLGGVSLGQQRREQLQQEREQLQRRIQEANAILAQTEQQSQQTFSQLKALQGQQAQRERLVASLGQEQQLLARDIAALSDTLQLLGMDVLALKKEYARMVLQAYKQTQGLDNLYFLFSSRDLRQLFSRVNYLQQYQQMRRKQIQAIEHKQQLMAAKRQQRQQRQQEAQSLLLQSREQQQEMQRLQQEQQTLVALLGHRADRLREQLRADERALSRMGGQLQEIATAEVLPTAADAKVLNKASLPELRGKMSWPVVKGFVSGKFGKHRHPVLQGIWVENSGVDIRTSAKAYAMSVLPGVVMAVTKVPDMQYMVVVDHGGFFTAYAHLEQPLVRFQQALKAGERIGQVSRNADGAYELQFQIWQGSQKLDPEQWLRLQ